MEDKRSSCSLARWISAPQAVAFATTSDKLTAGMAAPGRYDLTFATPGSPKRKASRAEASSTTLPTIRFLAALSIEFVNDAAAGLPVPGEKGLNVLGGLPESRDPDPLLVPRKNEH